MAVAIVTGANKGIGYHIVRGLAAGLPAGSTVYLGSRDAGRGTAAIEQIAAASNNTGTTIKLLQLEITDPASVAAAAASIQTQEPNGIDILVNNAGFAFKAAATEPRPVQAKETLRVNYHGTLAVSKAFIPMLRAGGRVVNVGSMAGGLGSWGASLRTEILNPALTEAQLTAFCARFVDDCEAGGDEQRGWPGTTYGVSKAAVHAMTRIHARDIGAMGLADAAGVTVNVCCPGWCKSDMAGWERPPKTAEQGADTPTWLALGGAGAATGSFFSDRKERGW